MTQATLQEKRDQVVRDFALLLDKLERDLAFLGRHPEIVEQLAGVVAQLHGLKSPLTGHEQIVERAAKLQASVAIAKARA